MAVTIIPSLTADQFAQRLAALFPNGWSSPEAKQPGGTLYALLKSLGVNLSFVLSADAYAAGSTRIQTAVAPELDLASQDFLGNILPRMPGETDAAYRIRILANIFTQAATRGAIVAALTKFTGVVPRVLEPWFAPDCGYFDVGISYMDIDSQANPARLGDNATRYQGFIITPLPQQPTGFGNPVRGYDDAAYLDVQNSYGGWFYDIAQLAGNAELDALITRLHAEGTIVWVVIVKPTTEYDPWGPQFGPQFGSG